MKRGTVSTHDMVVRWSREGGDRGLLKQAWLGVDDDER